MGKKIKGMGKPVKEAEKVQEERRLSRELKALSEAHLAADSRWIEQQREIGQERLRTRGLSEMAERHQTETTLLKEAAAASEQRVEMLSQRAEELEAERAAAQQIWCEAVERWQKLRFSLGLPFYAPEDGPPAWFTSAHAQRGLAQELSPGTEQSAELSPAGGH